MAKSSQRQDNRARAGAAGLDAVDGMVVLRGVFIAAAALWMFAPVLHGDWLWDDDVDVAQNPVIQSANGLWSIWFRPGTLIDYYPLKASVQWVQWHLWGDDTFGYHVTNLVLHIASSLLVWRLFHKLGLRLAWLGGLLFAIHPVQVESVAWITELKNTLSMPLFLLSMIFYVDYDTRGSRGEYVLALGFFLLAMLSKTTMVMFPVVLLLYAWWKRDRIGWNDLKASAPFFLVSLVLGWVTLRVGVWYDQLLQTPYAAPELGFLPRLALAGSSLAFYVWKAVWPVGLLPLYPPWKIDPPSLWDLLPWPILAGLLFWFWKNRAGWGRHALLGLGFFVIMLAPFVSVRVAGYMDFTWVMDHFLYIPIVGLIGLAVAGAARVEARLSATERAAGLALVAVVVVVLGFGSRDYAGEFVDNETLWTYALAQNPQSAVAHNNLGTAYNAEQRPQDALAQFQLAVQLEPDFAEANYNLGSALAKAGRFGEAIPHLQEALKTHPRDLQALNDLGYAFVHQGRVAEAIDLYQQALASSPDVAALQINLGNALVQAGRVSEALGHYQQALGLDPNSAVAWYLIGLAQMKGGQVVDAINAYRRAIALQPDFAPAHTNLGIALAQEGQTAEARAEFETALGLNPDDANARADLARLEAAAKPAR
jgi:tetratricopeptide (TPR) repeat protein